MIRINAMATFARVSLITAIRFGNPGPQAFRIAERSNRAIPSKNPSSYFFNQFQYVVGKINSPAPDSRKEDVKNDVAGDILSADLKGKVWCCRQLRCRWENIRGRLTVNGKPDPRRHADHRTPLSGIPCHSGDRVRTGGPPGACDGLFPCAGPQTRLQQPNAVCRPTVLIRRNL